MNNPLSQPKQDELINWLGDAYDIKILLVGISGSHRWGLDTEESDIDVRGIYRKPTEKILSIRSGSNTIDALDVLGEDIDIQLYEIEKALGMLLSNNGNLVELCLSPLNFYNSGDVDWQEIAKPFKTKQLAPYYEGYFHSQRKRAAKNRGGRALVYTYREIYAGTMLMRTGKIIHDFKQLRKEYEETFQPSSLLAKWLPREMWDKSVPDEQQRRFEKEWDGLVKVFKREVKSSSLPDDHDEYDRLNNLLLDLRW